MVDKNKTKPPVNVGGLTSEQLDKLLDAATTVTSVVTKNPRQLGKITKKATEMAKDQFKKIKDRQTRKAKKAMTSDEAYSLKEGGLAEATAKLKAKGFEDGGMVVKDKVVAIDTSPNSGLITTKGFGAGRKT